MMIKRRRRLKPRPKNQYRPHNKPKIPSFGTIVSLFSLLVISLAFFLLFRSDLLRLQKFDCTLNNQACQQNHQDLLRSYLHKNSLLIKPSKISQELLLLDLSLAQANVHLNFPNTLKADLISQSDTLTLAITTLPTPTLDVPIAETLIAELEATSSTQSSITPTPHPIIDRILSSDTPINQLATITQNGDIISLPQGEEQPKIYLTQSIESYSRESLSEIYHYNHELEQSAIFFDKAWVINSNLILSTKSSAFIVFILKNPPRSTIATLQQIRSQATINLDRAIIDLRFNKPVISTY